MLKRLYMCMLSLCNTSPSWRVCGMVYRPFARCAQQHQLTLRPGSAEATSHPMLWFNVYMQLARSGHVFGVQSTSTPTPDAMLSSEVAVGRRNYSAVFGAADGSKLHSGAKKSNPSLCWTVTSDKLQWPTVTSAVHQPRESNE